MNGATVKNEPGHDMNQTIKAEPASSPMDETDDDLDEDSGDLDFSDAQMPLWLVRLPKSLWENWSKLDDDEEFQIGMMRVEKSGNETKRISLRLDDLPQTRGLPKDYTLLQATKTTDQPAEPVKNTYVFTEKDKAGYKNAYFDSGNPTAGRSLLYEQMKREARKKQNKNRFQPYARKSIPKQTSLAGKIASEYHAIPVENEEYRRITELKVLAQKPRSGIKRIERGTDALLQPKLAVDSSSFIDTGKPKVSRVRDNKTIRMPQNELLDLIFDCFKRFKHWPFKSLKAELKQPEAYLKQTLEIVAVLVKSGDFASTWTLKPEAHVGGFDASVQDELPPTPKDESDADAMMTGTEEEEEFENVA